MRQLVSNYPKNVLDVYVSIFVLYSRANEHAWYSIFVFVSWMFVKTTFFFISKRIDDFIILQKCLLMLSARCGICCCMNSRMTHKLKRNYVDHTFFVLKLSIICD